MADAPVNPPDPEQEERQRRAAAAQARREQNIARQNEQPPFSWLQAGMAVAGAESAAQARHLQGMVRQTNQAWADEMDSRVSQAREMRRMENEQTLEAMRNQTELEKERIRADAMIRRLGQGGIRVRGPYGEYTTDEVRIG